MIIVHVQDTVKKWYRSEVLAVERATNGARRIFTHFIGWTARWDAWHDASSSAAYCACRGECACDGYLAPPGTQSAHTHRLENAKKTGVLEEVVKTPTKATTKSASSPSRVVRGVTGLRNLGNTV